MRYFIYFILAIATLVLAGCKNPPPQCDGSGESIRNLVTYHWLKGDHAEACRWLDRAVENRDYTACELLGWCYFMGDGVEQSNVQASRYFMRAAEIYWENWLLFIHFDNAQAYAELLLSRRVNDCGIRVSYRDDILKIMGLLNRAVLLGSAVAQAKKDFILLQLSKLFKDEASKNPSKDHLMELNKIIDQFYWSEAEATNALPIFCSKEDMRAGDHGRLPGLRDALLPDIAPQRCTNYTDLIALATDISGKTKYINNPCALPKPVRFSFKPFEKVDTRTPNNIADNPEYYTITIVLDDSDNCANKDSLEQHNSNWSWPIETYYADDDEPKVAAAYKAISDDYERYGLIVRIAKSLNLCKSFMPVDEWKDLRRKVVETAMLSEQELSRFENMDRADHND